MGSNGLATFVGGLGVVLALVAIFYAAEAIRRTKEFAEEQLVPLRKELTGQVAALDNALRLAQDRLKAIEMASTEAKREVQSEVAFLKNELNQARGETAAIGDALEKMTSHRRAQ